MNYCSTHLIQSIGKVSKLPTYSKKSGNGSNKIKKKPVVSKIHSILFSSLKKALKKTWSSGLKQKKRRRRKKRYLWLKENRDNEISITSVLYYTEVDVKDMWYNNEQMKCQSLSFLFIWKSFWQALQLGLPSSFFDELLLNTLDSIDWQSFKVADLLKKEWQRGKQNQKKACRVKNSLKCNWIRFWIINLNRPYWWCLSKHFLPTDFLFPS